MKKTFDSFLTTLHLHLKENILYFTNQIKDESNFQIFSIQDLYPIAEYCINPSYYRSAESPEFMTDKSPVKAIVIACNTATAYALDTVRILNL